jgi:hypothetical protein
LKKEMRKRQKGVNKWQRDLQEGDQKATANQTQSRTCTGDILVPLSG